MILVLVSTLVLAAALAAPRWSATRPLAGRLESFEATLRCRGPVIVATVTIAVVWFTWDQLAPIPKVHDENSYVLQADIFASGRWTAPSPPIPDFFEQPHVQVVPKLASKYPPGTALMWTPGAFLGWHAFMPLVLAGGTAILVFLLATRLTDPYTGMFAWLVWLTAPMVLRFQPSYFSEVVTTPLILASWWLLLDWRETRRARPLLLMALAIGWAAITRPLTALAFALPIGVVVIRDVARLRLWRDFGKAFMVGCVVLLILPLWSWRTTGSLRESPITTYRRDYMPFDKLGFTPDTTPPRRTVSPVLKSVYDYFVVARREQTLSAAPQIAVHRATEVVIAVFQEARLPLAVLALVGLLASLGGTSASRALLFGALSGLVSFLSHLSYPHWAPWTLYYLESVPVLAAFVAVGAVAAARRLNGGGDQRTSMALAFVAVALFAIPNVPKWKEDHRARGAFDRRFISQLELIPQKPAIVFVSYSRRVAQHIAVVWNSAHLDEEPVWVVHDLGPRNAELRKLAPNRASFDFEEDQLVRAMPRR